ncbi:sulfurtransferase [Marinomonas balearica]|uniref:Thiosulfate/3-mercaptopyruvate sulfurtransferase n=1 Tax=Marinomonas balearica TaxID=491947 RepID=A0A4R6M4R0_9GAMM|nr:sulfurtransferase [Marinomonas balearica]TDO96308.1 thiosulfate/3-mercaptopyruvate sulfurtransferase [Marinomonas balearica]
MTIKTLISVDELASMQGQRHLVVLDCRFYLTDLEKGARVYNESHIPDAIFVDLHSQLAGEESELTGRHPLPSAARFSEQISNWGIDLNSEVVVYDDMGGAFAARAWWMLAQQGISVRVLNGGFPEWLRSGNKVTQNLPENIVTRVPIEVSFPWLIHEEQIVTSFESNQYILLDARMKDRFNGENENMDPVAGHIPGALNRPFFDNLDEKQTFKAANLINTEFSALLGGGGSDLKMKTTNLPVVHYCGSGVTACHNILAMNYAGFEAKYVYVGSWSQWAKRMVRMLRL